MVELGLDQFLVKNRLTEWEFLFVLNMKVNQFIFQLFVGWGQCYPGAEWSPITIRVSSILQKSPSVFWLISKHLLSKHPREFWQEKVPLVNQIQCKAGQFFCGMKVDISFYFLPLAKKVWGGLFLEILEYLLGYAQTSHIFSLWVLADFSVFLDKIYPDRSTKYEKWLMSYVKLNFRSWSK